MIIRLIEAGASDDVARYHAAPHVLNRLRRPTFLLISMPNLGFRYLRSTMALMRSCDCPLGLGRLLPLLENRRLGTDKLTFPMG
ncbi:MAG: hypothetical protein ACI9ON_003057 [Limisphaerales bacterium]